MKFIFLFVFSILTNAVFSQQDSLVAPYLRFPTLPPIQLLLSDSITKFSRDDLPKKKPVLLMLFSPDCSHCQHTALEFHKYRDELKNIQVVMATMHPLSQMRDFIRDYKLDSLENLVVGQDIYYFMSSFYSVRNLPFMAFYDKKGRLISVFEGAMPLEKVIALFKANK